MYLSNTLDYDPNNAYISRDVDFSGERVRKYHYLCQVFNTVNLVRMAIAGIYHRQNNYFNYVEFTPNEFKSEQIKIILKRINSLKGSLLFKNTSTFQRNSVRSWNPNYDKICQLIIPKVMLHDEITTDGYGKCVIELMTLHGILEKCNAGDNTYEWRLGRNWQNKKIILCLDGLSLDRHRGFCNKLMRLPLSFTKAYQQSQIFQKALTRVVDISGPLHMSFHMLQSIFIVYNCFLKGIQQCLGWKKIQFTKVSDNYRLCVAMIDIAYEEVFRLLFYSFLIEYSTTNFIPSDETMDEMLAIDLSIEFHKWIDKKIALTTDERYKLLLCFFKITNTHKRYEKAMRAGDAIEMEVIENEFCGVFLLLDKNNYVEIILSQMEKKYDKSEYSQLHEIRCNIAARYYKDNMNKNDDNAMHVLDELMENVNMWVKALPLGDDRESWVVHSPNVMVARKCLLFEKMEYRRGHVDFEHLVKTGVSTQRQYKDSAYVAPRRIIEKQRVYEFLTLYFGKETSGRKSCANEMYYTTEKLTVILNDSDEDNNLAQSNESADEDLDLLFDTINEMNGSNINNDTNEVSEDEDIDIDDDQNDNSSSVHIRHHKYTMTDILSKGNEEMKKKNYVDTRLKKKRRMKRHEDFITRLYENLIVPDNKREEAIFWLESSSDTLTETTPSFTELFSSVKTHNT